MVVYGTGSLVPEKLQKSLMWEGVLTNIFQKKSMRAWSSGLRCRSPKPYDAGSNPAAFAKS